MKTAKNTLFSGFVALLIASAFTLRAQNDVRYDIAAMKSVMVTMRDGVRLSTDVYQPARDGHPVEGKFPVLLERTPYNKERLAASANYFVPRGYVVVLQDVRGRYQSEGRWVPIRDDPNDGFDTTKWIGAQPWSDGSIGTMGSSYDGATQHALAIANAPYVKAMVPRNAMSDFGRYGVRHNGAFELRFFNWVMTLGYSAGSPDAGPAAVPCRIEPGRRPCPRRYGRIAFENMSAVCLSARERRL